MTIYVKVIEIGKVYYTQLLKITLFVKLNSFNFLFLFANLKKIIYKYIILHIKLILMTLLCW